jgi:hypothetical protein
MHPIDHSQQTGFVAERIGPPALFPEVLFRDNTDDGWPGGEVYVTNVL